MTYSIGERYLFCDSNDKIFTGDVADVSETTLWIQNVSDNHYHKGTSRHSIPLEMIVSSFRLSELIPRNRYTFTKADNTAFVSFFDSITDNSHGSTLHVTSGAFRYSMPLLFIKSVKAL